VLRRSASHEYLIFALRLNQPDSILPAQLAVCGIFPHIGLSTVEEMVWYLWKQKRAAALLIRAEVLMIDHLCSSASVSN